MKSSIFGIPFVIIFFFIGLGIIIDGFVYFVDTIPTQQRLNHVDSQVTELRYNLLLTPSATATPSATPTETFRAVAPVVRLSPVVSK